MKKLEIKPGRSASVIGIVMGIIGVVFVIFWIGMLLRLSDPWNQEMEPGVLFLLIFGVMFFIAVIVITSFYVRNTFARKRPSLVDVEEETLEEFNKGGSTVTRSAPDGEISFCPYCGKTFKKEFLYCQYCGEKVIT